MFQTIMANNQQSFSSLLRRQLQQQMRASPQQQQQQQQQQPQGSSSYSHLLPTELFYYLSFLPSLQSTINTFMTFTPLFSYGTTCYSIYRKRTSRGFSIDICGTMFLASILRCFYYVCSPFEITLLRQSLVMIGIQSVLLYISLRYREGSNGDVVVAGDGRGRGVIGETYDPELLSPLPSFKTELNRDLPRRMSSSTLITNHVDYSKEGFSKYTLDTVLSQLALYKAYLVVGFKQTLRLFDVYYRRPGLFWQWSKQSTYWYFLLSFTAFIGSLTAIFHDSTTYANIIGISGLFIESLLPLPQILMLNRLRSVDGFKVLLLLSWLGGDCTKLSYLLYGTDDVSVIFILAGLFQMSLDIFIAVQYVTLKYYYDQFWRRDNYVPLGPVVGGAGVNAFANTNGNASRNSEIGPNSDARFGTNVDSIDDIVDELMNSQRNGAGGRGGSGRGGGGGGEGAGGFRVGEGFNGESEM
ncbi:conserved hypothetical protein [Lodderomyces elongisporus NRRL YB-4239]|uniref:PQ-loop repeat-containing protein 1 n=1 Tax=Lodderomyces elongisporus (strain ATCC 11503 / CBS 2605 / JCM 1781 / NBRC 1676 / NRRL YB-4239) TaxID=379508 RepID=A5DWB5_LODEL|nr:conserved hypothetical protein [Lodderomyces elongisporus NRRL YB-4239]